MRHESNEISVCWCDVTFMYNPKSEKCECEKWSGRILHLVNSLGRRKLQKLHGVQTVKQFFFRLKKKKRMISYIPTDIWVLYLYYGYVSNSLKHIKYLQNYINYNDVTVIWWMFIANLVELVPENSNILFRHRKKLMPAFHYEFRKIEFHASVRLWRCKKVP